MKQPDITTPKWPVIGRPASATKYSGCNCYYCRLQQENFFREQNRLNDTATMRMVKK